MNSGNLLRASLQANQSGTVDAPLTTIRGQKHATGNIKFTYNLVGVPDDGSMA